MQIHPGGVIHYYPTACAVGYVYHTPPGLKYNQN